MTANLIALAVGLALALGAALVSNRWRYHDGFRAGYKAGTEATKRELDDLFGRLGIPCNETGDDSLATIQARLDDMIERVDTNQPTSVKAA